MSQIQAPENMTHLVFEGESSELYHYIWRSSQQCLEEAKASFAIKEIDSEELEQVKTVIEEELSEAKEYRFSLSTVDNRIQKNKIRNPDLRKYFSQKTSKGQRNSNYLLLELFTEPPPESIDSKVIQAALPLRNDFNHSLRLRIKMIWCWDEILKEQQEILLIRVQKLGSQLLFLAIELKDEESEQLVKEILLSLDLRATESDGLKSELPKDIGALKDQLQKGVTELNRVYNSITHLDQQRQSIKKTQTQIQNQIEKPYSSRMSANYRFEAEEPVHHSQTRRMVFGHEND